ncbi:MULTISPECIES: sulfur oxidation c-type cytochrome SoxA [unclassified Leisingera]|uniref:sulfur oxidation c-type cytochrome SoxA n=1 Tax=unclassified Leisingera TaxID=2614906 RepID=UPI001010FD0B|nr:MULTISPECIES: sulfur oxidation c-type cytochrome SoxA [unclassified Leisingera]MBQ4824956.1 sulfur oxidation c-type cytochrome SoxA [Leisingera sp. HS039]QAX29385.1 sulfur oxidation c-type cytochrome SoxA [Leisingera sp. NJS204]QBR36143.1 sulfur oxidation c-type cytochrome SoxA [Leisingera sp. NJS201]
MNKKAITAIAAVLALPMAASAGPDDDTLVVNEEIEMVTKTAAPAHIADAMDEVMSGWHFRKDETQSLQMDDFENPAMIFVDQAIDTWSTVEGSEGKSCASCHDDAEESMAGVRAVYPKWNEAAGEVRTLNMQINDCRENQMGAEKWKYSGGKMAAMEALISVQSRGMPVNVAIDGPAQSTWEQGKEMYYTRTGQLELSCANCHEDNYGNMIRADHLSQGQINGFPVYRLKNTKLNTAHARFKGCIRDTRAETYKPGSAEFVALELYVASRGNGLSVEAPSVRN